MNNLSSPESVPQEDRRPIPGYEGRYEIDRQGNIYALFPHRGLQAGRKLRPATDTVGYVRAALSQNARSRSYSVHRLVMLAWCPVENSRQLDVNHIDGNKQNNDLSNLEWVTHKANIHHARSVLGINRDQRGDNAGYRKLTSEIVREIRRMYASGVLQKDIALIYGVTQHAISDVIARRSWASVD